MYKNIFNYIPVMIFYFVLSFGTVLPVHNSNVNNIAAVTLCFIVFLYFSLTRRVSISRKYLIIIWIVFFILLLQLSRSNDWLYALSKIDGYIICLSILIMIYRRTTHSYAENIKFWSSYVDFSVIILAATVLFKIQFGFWDRDIRFLFNGSIIFGWLMALSAISSLFLYSRTPNLLSYKWLVLFVGFCLAVVWTESKGALLSLAAGIAVYSISTNSKLIKTVAVLSFVLMLSIFVIPQFYLSLFDDTRYASIFRFMLDQSVDSDWGSIGVRQEMFEYSIHLIEKHPLIGIGLGNFDYLDFFYPHNQHLEIFVEIGIFLFISHVLLILCGFYFSSGLYRALIVAFTIGSSFSGDIAYLRFLYLFIFLALLSSNQDAFGKFR